MINECIREVYSIDTLCIFFCCSVYFFERSTSIECLYNTILLKRYHTISDSCFIDDSCTCPIDYELLYARSYLENFIDTNSTFVAYIFTLCTSDSFIKYRISKYFCRYARQKLFFCCTFKCFFDTSFKMWIKIIHWYSFLTVLAKLAYKTLCDDRIDRSGKEKCRNSHIEYTSERLGSRVRMDRRYYKVTSKCGFNSDVDRFMISYFSYHYYVWILTEGSSESKCKVISNIRKHLGLIESVDLTFYWIFKCHDVDVWLIEI